MRDACSNWKRKVCNGAKVSRCADLVFLKVSGHSKTFRVEL